MTAPLQPQPPPLASLHPWTHGTSSSWGWDVDLNYCVTASQGNHEAVPLAQKLTREQLLK